MAEQVKGVDGEEYVKVDGRWYKAVPAEAVIPAEAPEEEGGA